MERLKQTKPSFGSIMGSWRKRKRLLWAVVASCGVSETIGRSWRDIETHHEMEVMDVSARFYRDVEELHYKSMVMKQVRASQQLESSQAVRAERQPTTVRPSPRPSSMPSKYPSLAPTSKPTLQPSSEPTREPSLSPTADPYAPNVPIDPDPTFFNYDTSPTAQYGPGQLVAKQQSGFFTTTIENNWWGNVRRPELGYWDEFTAESGFGPWKQILDIHQPWRNKCASGVLQSPIDLSENGGTCQEHHEVRSLPGDFGLRGRLVKKVIEANKLRLVYQRRPCSNLTNVACQEPDPPAADFPSGWAGYADVLHIDFKVPSEHTIKGERFDAEMQIFHLHPSRRRIVAQAVVIKAQKDGHNYYLQEALDAFQREFDNRMQTCQKRNLAENNDSYGSWAKFYTFGGTGPRERLDFGGGTWDPHHPMLVPTIYFYRYDGSLTEPPCGEFVTWWVADRPMTIGLEQLEQMQHILFLSLDTSCNKMSVQYKRSVARPVQKINNRPVWRCNPSNFGPD